MVNLKLPSYVFSKFAVLVGLCVFQCLTLLTIVYFACQLKGNYWQTAAILICLVAGWSGAGLGDFRPQQHDGKRDRVAARGVAAGDRIGRRNSRHLQDAGPPAQWLSYAAPSRWAFEANVVNEAQGHPCGLTARASTGTPVLPARVKAWMQRRFSLPEAVIEANGEKVPAPLAKGQKSLRHSFWQSLGVLAGMTAVLLGAVLGFLRMRDIH